MHEDAPPKNIVPVGMLWCSGTSFLDLLLRIQKSQATSCSTATGYNSILQGSPLSTTWRCRNQGTNWTPWPSCSPSARSLQGTPTKTMLWPSPCFSHLLSQRKILWEAVEKLNWSSHHVQQSLNDSWLHPTKRYKMQYSWVALADTKISVWITIGRVQNSAGNVLYSIFD